MAEINNIPSLAFATSVDSIMIAADADISVRTLLTADDGSAVFDNTAMYTPTDGKVEIGGIDELVCSSILSTIDAENLLAAGPRSIGVNVTVSGGGYSASCRLLYSTRFLGNVAPHFATQIRNRKIYTGQQMPLSVITAGKELKLHVGLALRDGETVRYEEKEVSISPSKDCYTMDAGITAILTMLNCHTYGAEAVYFYTLTLYSTDGQQLDKIKFTAQGQMPRHATQFVFLGFCGVPETFVFTGKNIEKQSLESDFGFSGREYIRLDSSLVEDNEANSGWVTMEERATVYDLMDSPLAFVVDGKELRRITITDVDSSVSRPVNEPDAISLTWRYADMRYMRKPVFSPDTGSGHVFSHPPFDKTFS